MVSSPRLGRTRTGAERHAGTTKKRDRQTASADREQGMKGHPQEQCAGPVNELRITEDRSVAKQARTQGEGGAPLHSIGRVKLKSWISLHWLMHLVRFHPWIRDRRETNSCVRGRREIPLYDTDAGCNTAWYP